DSASGRGPAIDRAAIETLLAGAKRPRTAGSTTPARRFFIYTSGVWVLGRTEEPATEDAPINPIAMVSFRAEHERPVLDAAGSLRTAVIRPGVVYGGGNGIIGDLFRSAANGLVRVVGDGNNH